MTLNVHKIVMDMKKISNSCSVHYNFTCCRSFLYRNNTVVFKHFLSQDITRIAHLLSKTVRSNIPCAKSEFGPGQQVDINAVLSVVEDFIKQNNKTSDTAQSKTQSFHNLVQPQLPGVYLL